MTEGATVVIAFIIGIWILFAFTFLFAHKGKQPVMPVHIGFLLSGMGIIGAALLLGLGFVVKYLIYGSI